MKSHCKRGHPLSGPNVYLYRGHNLCRACRERYARLHKDEKAKERAERKATRATHEAELVKSRRIARHQKLLAEIEALAQQTAEANASYPTPVTPERVCKKGHPLDPDPKRWGCPVCRAEWRRSTKGFAKKALGYHTKKGA